MGGIHNLICSHENAPFSFHMALELTLLDSAFWGNTRVKQVLETTLH